MNQRVEPDCQLLRDFIASFVDQPERISLTVGVRNRLDKVFFTLRVDPSDYGKVAGKQGSHIKALQYLVGEIGQTNDASYELELIGNPMAATSRAAEVRAAGRYDPEPNRKLLERLVQTLHPGNSVKVTEQPKSEGGRIDLLFTITAPNAEAYNDLLAPYEDDPSSLTVAIALGTLWRAAGCKDGVKFRLEVRNAQETQTA